VDWTSHGPQLQREHLVVRERRGCVFFLSHVVYNDENLPADSSITQSGTAAPKHWGQLLSRTRL